MSRRSAMTCGLLPILAILFALTVDPALAGYRTTGRWTSKSDPGTQWEGLAIHLVLTRGYGSHHSQILWYNSHDVVDYDFEGGVWGWNPGTSPATSNCSSYPAATMTELGVGQPTKNVFCSGMSVLKSGHGLISGGTESGETGLRHLTIFDPATRSWSQQPDMAERRWYPTNTLLPDGRALISSGSTYTHLWSFGGRATPNQGLAVTDSLQLLAGTIAAHWDPAVKVSTPTAPWPAGRDAHSGYFNRSVGAMVVFAGRTNSPFEYNDQTFYVSRKPDSDAGAIYSSFEVARTFESPSRPSARIRQTAIGPGDSTTIVFGGRDVFSAGNDLWRLFKDGPIWKWQSLSPTGAPPSGRQGHTALWDDDNERMLVFGGTAVDAFEDAVPTDATVYALDLSPSPAWVPVTVDPDPLHGSPSPRHGHALVLDGVPRSNATQGPPDANHSRRAILFGGKGSSGLLSDLWVLWFPEPGSGANYLWEKIGNPPGDDPSGRFRFAAEFEGVNDRLVISGGDLGGSATAETWAIPLDHLTSSNDRPWVRLADHPVGPVTGHSLVPGALNWSLKQEIFDPTTGSTSLAGSSKRQDWYPFHFVSPRSDTTFVFAAGPDTQSWYLNVSSSPATWRPFPYNPTPGFRSGAAVMYRPGEVMRCGSRDTDQQGGTARGMTQVLSLNASPPPSSWTTTDSMTIGRTNHNLVILPNGLVLAVGGTQTIRNNLNDRPVFRPQIWRPLTKTWTSMSGADTLAADSTIRGYHSNAILLPDGRVLSVSGNPTEDNGASQAAIDARRATVYCPPYMFDASDNLKTRATVLVPDSINYGTTFNICVEGSGSAPVISSVALIRPAASTHGVNMDQRYVPLTFQSECQRRTLVVSAPIDSFIAPPGDYMLFVVKSDSMPSIASWVRVGSPESDPPLCIGCSQGGGAMMASGGEGESEDSGTEENSLLLAEEATRAYRLVGDPTTETGYVLRIRQEPGGSTTIRDVLLQAVDHDPGQELFSLGDRIVSAVRQPAVGVYDRAGQPIHDVLNSDLGWSGTELDTLTVVLVASETGAESAPALRPLVFEARRGSRDLTSSADSPSITILDRLGPSAMGSGTPIEPRVGFETVGVDSCLSTIRLVVQPGTQIRNLGSLVQVSSEIAGISPALSEAVISSVASVAGGLTPTGLRATTLTPGDVLRLRWSATPVPAGKARTFFVRATSTTESLESASETAGTQNAIVSAHRFSLAAARPNPFTSETTLDYSLGAAGPLSIKVYDVAGRLVRTLLAGTRPAGPGSIAWNGADDRGVMVNAGVYFARMESGTWSSGRKVMLLGR